MSKEFETTKRAEAIKHEAVENRLRMAQEAGVTDYGTTDFSAVADDLAFKLAVQEQEKQGAANV